MKNRSLPAIMVAMLGANAGYIALVGAGILLFSPEDPVGYPGFWSWAAVGGYVCCGLPVYLGLGAGVGLFLSDYAKRKSLSKGTTLLLSFAIAAVIGALLAIPIYFFAVMAAAL